MANYTNLVNSKYTNKNFNLEGVESLGENIEKGLDFILRHIPTSQPQFPRHIMTYALGRQLEVFSKEEAIQYFKDSNYLDCRIRAYPPPPPISDFLGTNPIPPSTIKIDLDRSTFRSDNSHQLALTKTLANILQNLGASPTVLWSGNGYHIYQPICAVLPLEQIEDFNEFEVQQISVRFLRFAEWYLSNGKSDRSHNNTASFGNYLFRIPGSHNSKCVLKNNGVLGQSTEVKILQEWDGYRPTIGLLIGSFYAYLVDQKYKDSELQKFGFNAQQNNCNTMIPWIEKLLQTPLKDNRKFAILWVIAPYLITKRGMPDQEAFSIIKKWTTLCNQLERLNPPNFNSKIKDCIKYVKKSGKFPMGLPKLKVCNTQLYRLLEDLKII